MLSPELINFSSVTFDSRIKFNLKDLQEEKNFCDVIIACENQHVEAHKVILSVGSLVFKKILKENPHHHPLICLNDIKFSHLLKMLDFMYQGEVIIDQKELGDFLSVASDLKVKGLAKDAAKDFKQLECFTDEGSNRKKQRLVNSLNQDFNVDDDINIAEGAKEPNGPLPDCMGIDSKVYELSEDIVKDSKQSEHFAHEDNGRKSKPMVTIPYQSLNLDYGIKTEMDDLSCEPSCTEKIKEKNQLQDEVNTNIEIGEIMLNMGERRLRIRDISKLSENNLQSSSLSFEKDVSENVNSSHLNGQYFSVHERVGEPLKKSFMCMQCNKKYSRKWNLSVHIKSIHGGDSFSCDKCDFTTKLKRSLNNHIYTVHNGNILGYTGMMYSCSFCDHKATTKCALKIHVKICHKTHAGST